jgi:hypothetical protein
MLHYERIKIKLLKFFKKRNTERNISTTRKITVHMFDLLSTMFVGLKHALLSKNINNCDEPNSRYEILYNI